MVKIVNSQKKSFREKKIKFENKNLLKFFYMKSCTKRKVKSKPIGC